VQKGDKAKPKYSKVAQITKDLQRLKKGVASSVSRYSSWSKSYSKSYFKGGYSWTKTVSASDSESVTKGDVSTSNGRLSHSKRDNMTSSNNRRGGRLVLSDRIIIYSFTKKGDSISLDYERSYFSLAGGGKLRGSHFDINGDRIFRD
jgi:hypothetical protein